MSTSNNIATPSPRRRRQIFWRRVQSLAGLALALAVFMPAVDGCNEPVYPIRGIGLFVASFHQNTTLVEQLGERMMSFAMFFSAYVFGALVLIFSIKRTNLRIGQQSRFNAVALNLLAGIVFIPFALWPIWAFASGNWPSNGVDVPDIIFTAIATCSTVYWLLAIRGGAKGTFCLRWYMSLLCVIWFTAWVTDRLFGGTVLYYGMWTSFIASLIIFIALTAEARIHTRAGTWPTIGCLFICRFRALKHDDSQCENCGYLLTGLTVPRCPECGQPFAWPDQQAELPPSE